MRTEVSAGGIVIFGNALLLLKKFNGAWVLPKGKIESGESQEEAAIREVYEESGVSAEIVSYVGKVHYDYRNTRDNDTILKTVHWFIMKTKSMGNTNPQKEEGFVEARYVPFGRATQILQYDDERQMVLKALDMIRIEE